jgi:lysophospholipase L1-like esterase
MPSIDPGWIVWLIAACVAASFAYGIRRRAKMGLGLTRQRLTRRMLVAAAVVSVPALALPPLHVLWLVPASWIIGNLSLTFPLSLLWAPADLYGRLCCLGLPTGKPPSGQRVVFLGDSITDCWPLNRHFPGKSYANRGVAGQTTRQIVRRMKADVLDFKPEVLLVLGGTNDLARGVPPETIRQNLAAIGDLAWAQGTRPVFASVLPVSDHHEARNLKYQRTKLRPLGAIAELNRWLRQVCEERGFVYLDYFSAMVDGNGQLRASLAEDGLHPNEEGYRTMAPLARAAIDLALAVTSANTRPAPAESPADPAAS